MHGRNPSGFIFILTSLRREDYHRSVKTAVPARRPFCLEIVGPKESHTASCSILRIIFTFLTIKFILKPYIAARRTISQCRIALYFYQNILLSWNITQY